MVLRRWENITGNLVLTAGMKTQIGHRYEFGAFKLFHGGQFTILTQLLKLNNHFIENQADL